MSTPPAGGPGPEADPIGAILETDDRYPRGAYEFVHLALRDTLNRQTGPQKHVSATQLLEGLRAYAIRQFGPLVRTVFADWGVRSTADIGAIVFNLIAVEAMRRTEDDQLSDFDDVYDFAEVFPEESGPAAIPPADPDEAFD